MHHRSRPKSPTLGTGIVLAALLAFARPSAAQHPGHPSPPSTPPASPHGHQGHDASEDQPTHGLFGPYPMSREASGTAWQPDSTPVEGLHLMRGGWMIMIHAMAHAVYNRQGGPRGDEDVFGPSMGMVMAQRPAGRGRLGARAMVSLDPATVGKRGYPLLLQTGETGDGRTRLIDRQHPHDLFMELAASYSLPVNGEVSAFGYVGYPGEPALGPPTFMHRFSGMPLPESPLMHHWLDSTHITFGVATAGITWKGLRVEASSFTGREPDERRWNFDKPRFDSYSGRVSVNPTPHWSFQVSAGHLTSPEQLEPDVDIDRFTASGMYNHPLGESNWQTTLTWGRNRKHGENLDGVLLESALRTRDTHTFFVRAETVEKDELFEEGPLVGMAFWVEKVSAGYIYDFAKVSRVGMGLGGLVSFYGIPEELHGAYDDRPVSFMVFLRGAVR